MKIVALSDTHGMHDRVKVYDGDVLIHCGDFSRGGTLRNYMSFIEWFKNQPHEHKLFTPGNHDGWVEHNRTAAESIAKDAGVTMLINQEYVIEGVKFYGSPFTPTFYDWSFMLDRDQIGRIWEKIPEDVDVLFTHGPPYGHGDLAPAWNESSLRGRAAGDLSLLLRVKETKPQVHFFGHIHGGYGRTKSDDMGTLFVNCAICTERYSPDHTAQIVDL